MKPRTFFIFFLAYPYIVEASLSEAGLNSNSTLVHATSAQSPNSRLTCPEEIINGNKYGTFHFPETEADERGIEIKVECPAGFRNNGYKSIYDESKAMDTNAALSGVKRSCFLMITEDSARAEWRPPLSDTVVRKDNYCKAVEWREAIQKWNTALERVKPLTFQFLWPQVMALQNYCALEDYDCAMALVNGYASLLTSPQLNGEGGIGQEQRNMIFRRLEEFISDLGTILPVGLKVQIGDNGIVVETAKLHGTHYFAKTISTKTGNDASHNAFMNSMGIKSYETKLKPVGLNHVFIDISAEAVYKAMIDSSNDPQVKITAYNQEIFKSWSGEGTLNKKTSPSQICGSNARHASQEVPQNEEVDCIVLAGENSTSCKNASEPYETWGLLCIELNGSIENLTEPVEFIISNESEVPDEHHLVCAYWDQDAEVWSTDGVTTAELENGVKCSSTHLTAFSALIEPLPLPFPGAEYAPINNSIHSYILSILSSIGSVVSIIGLFFTLLTFAIFKTLRRERSNRILINLSLSLLCLHIMSVSGSKSLWDDHCFVPALSLHYLVLTSLAWMMVEAIHMFELLISVFVRPETRFLLKRIVLAWGIPLIIVSICASVQPQVYYLARADLCLMNAHENIILYYGAYIGPVCIMLLINLIIFIRIFRVFYQQTKRTTAAVNQGKGNAPLPKYYLIKISPSQIKGATSVLVLLGIGWVLGLLAMGPFEVLFRYMYCICNAGQGLFIFIFRVVLNPQACKQWKKVIVGFSPDSSLDASVTTSSTASGKRKLQRKSTIISPTFISASNSVENSLTASNPMSTNLANTLAAILKAENDRVTGQIQDMK